MLTLEARTMLTPTLTPTLTQPTNSIRLSPHTRTSLRTLVLSTAIALSSLASAQVYADEPVVTPPGTPAPAATETPAPTPMPATEPPAVPAPTAVTPAAPAPAPAKDLKQ